MNNMLKAIMVTLIIFIITVSTSWIGVNYPKVFYSIAEIILIGIVILALKSKNKTNEQ